MELESKKAVIFGVANKRSLAWSIANTYAKNGASLTLVCQNERLLKKVVPLAESIGAQVLVCDLSVEGELEKVFESVGDIDILVHSIAYAPTESISSPLSDVSKLDFLQTMEISVYSLVQMVGVAKNYLNENASVITLTYLGSQRVMSGYNLMGVAKAALEASVRYLSVDLGEQGHRINAISAGPVKTLSSSVFPNFNKALDLVKERTPLKENISGEDVAELASFLASSRAKLITGTIHYVDSGAHIIGA